MMKVRCGRNTFLQNGQGKINFRPEVDKKTVNETEKREG